MRRVASSRCLKPWFQRVNSGAVHKLLGGATSGATRVTVLRDDVVDASTAFDGIGRKWTAGDVKPVVAGNKRRKLWTLLGMPPHEFPGVLASCGGAQSNSMRAIASLVQLKQREAAATSKGTQPHTRPCFVYFTPPLPRVLRENPHGNFRDTLRLGACIVPLRSHEQYRSLAARIEAGASPVWQDVVAQSGGDVIGADFVSEGGGSATWVPQGGACGAARAGCFDLADDIAQWWRGRGRGHAEAEGEGGTRSLLVVLPAGTGTTAVFVHERLCGEPNVRVACVACVGNVAYLRDEMEHMLPRAWTGGLPHILPPPACGASRRERYRFASPSPDLLRQWTLLHDAGLEPDLIYAPPTWLSLRNHLGALLDDSPSPPPTDILYVHTGGQEGNESALERYRRAGMLG